MAEDQDIAAFYSDRYRRFGDTPQAFDWGSRESQLKRFRVLAKVDDLNGKSVLDVGCGTADLYLYLRKAGVKCDYHGCDLVPEFIEEARRKTPGRFYQGDFLKTDFDRQFDYVLCSGTLNYLGKDACRTAFIALDKMFELAKDGVGVNFRSSLARRPGALYVVSFDPCQVLAYSLARYGSRVLLDHSCLPHDFTLFVFKRDFPLPPVDKTSAQKA